MSWGMIGASAISAVATIGSKYIGAGSGGLYGDMEIPEYYEDPDYRETQDYLKEFGMDITKGDIPDYYKGIGESGGEEFENMLGLTNRDITQSTSEALAKSGRARGGQLAASSAQAIGDSSVKARYEDYNRAMTGKQNLLTTGIGVTESARSAGQTEGSNVNAHNMGAYNAAITERNYQAIEQEKADAATGSMIGTVVSTGLGAFSGYQSGGWGGAAAGAADALTGGNTSFLSNLGKIKTSGDNNKTLTDQELRDYYNNPANRA